MTICIANWKMHGDRTLVTRWVAYMREQLKAHRAQAIVAVCPPFPLLPEMQRVVAGTPIMLGAQDVDVHDAGAFTGQVAAAMLTECDCRYVLIGHSERRAYYGESDIVVREKLQQAVRHGLQPILCVGESLATREKGDATAFVSAQIDAACTDGLPEHCIIAYEPIWAIGTGKHADPEDAEAMHAHIRAHIRQTYKNTHNPPILYGGSVKAANAHALCAMPNIDGVLVGGASLDPEEFAVICKG